MSNGTRIDPEEREPRAIKIRQPKNNKPKIIISLIAAVIIIASGAFAFLYFGDYITLPEIISSEKEEAPSGEETETPSGPEVPEKEEVSSEPEKAEEPETPEISKEPEFPDGPELPEVSEEPEPVIEEDPIPRDEWFMVLVNKENPLPEDFTIEATVIDQGSHTVDARIADDLSAMISAGEKEGLRFSFYTAYRSIAKQKELFEAGKTTAAPGTSEHNSGLALDIGCAAGEFEGSPEEKWLLENAHEYGFILRYPEGKEDITGFEHEPWHFRYVGKEQAKLIFESGLCLEEYLAQ